MSLKSALHQAIDQLSESECAQVLLLIKNWRTTVAPALERLAENPTFRVPKRSFPVFAPVSPIQGTGTSASAQLAEDRH